MRYAVVIEKADGNYSAYVPDLPGCVATGPTIAAIEEEIRAAIRFHLEGLRADGLDVPQPTSIAEYVEAYGAKGRDRPPSPRTCAWRRRRSCAGRNSNSVHPGPQAS
jgi:predicted RNase H-like HicB family nuclease